MSNPNLLSVSGKFLLCHAFDCKQFCKWQQLLMWSENAFASWEGALAKHDGESSYFMKPLGGFL